MEIIGYLSASLMGIVLGVIGGGGSVLTVPILVYLMGIAPDIATGYSLLIVGLTAAFGAIRYFRQGLVDIPASIAFAIPAILAVYGSRAYLMPNIPSQFEIASLSFAKNVIIMVVFAILMLLSAILMLKKAYQHTDSHLTSASTFPTEAPIHINWFLIIIEGAVVGVITGILGAGGGFLIIPALVLLMGMPMHKAVGASLFIIALKSLIGFIGDLQNGIVIEMPMIPLLLIATGIGMFLSTHISSRLESQTLQKIFAFFTLIIAVVIISKELL
ncbi:sulfite exporter TauE/SafE family protein [Celerinatantimonas sp. YJH-8]|uniref:sulfite exporter TauE/SafE family protein n=1 Tax=Celerinatantimonas sp. YJH-8 TaxID=3228714 RepID=UPI0038C6EA70